MNAPAPAPAAAPRAAAPRLARRAALVLLALLAALSAGGLAGAQWLWRTESGLVSLARWLPQLTGGVVRPEGVRGTLARRFEIDRLRIDAGSTTVEVHGLRAQLRAAHFGLNLAALRLDFDQLTADSVRIHAGPVVEPATPPPASIAAPVNVTVAQLIIGTLTWTSGPTAGGGSQTVLRQLRGAVALSPSGYRIDEAQLAVGPAQAPLQLGFRATIDGAHPFAVTGSGTLAASLQAQAVQAQWQASGSLVDLQLRADARGGGARGHAELRLALFDAPTLRALDIDLADLDPAAWLAGAPTARLSIDARLLPAPDPAFALQGPVQIDNALAGTVDAGRIPLRSLRARIELTPERLQARDLRAVLLRGVVSGSYEMSLTDVRRFSGQATLQAVDLSALHARLRPLVLDGELGLRHEGETSFVTGQLVHRGRLPAQLDVDLSVTPRLLQIGRARLVLGGGLASLSGTVALAGSQRTQVEGALTDFDPALLVEGLRARLSGRFAVDAALAPQPAGRIEFMLTDSQAFGRPLAGRGVLELDALQALRADVDLTVRSASLRARGALGVPDQTLQVELDVPALQDLGLPARGRLEASARLAGDWHAPAVDLQVVAQRLRIGEHAIDLVRAIGRYGGGSDGALAVQVNATNHRFRERPALSLQSTELSIDGRLAAHQIVLAAVNEESQELRAAARGGWESGGAQWRGEVTRLTAGAPLNLALAGALPLSTNGADLRLGPAALTLAGTRFEDVSLERSQSVLTTRGRFSGLQWANPDRGERLVGATTAPPLTLRGEWQLRAGAAVDGDVLIERSGGDIVAGDSSTGIGELRVQAQIRSSRLQAQARLRGTRAGELSADLQAEVDPARPGLARDRPWLITARTSMPSIAWVNALLGTATRTNLRLGGSLDGELRIDGTPGDPVAQGRFGGKDLRVAWIEQAIRLENGTLAARLAGSEILLDELRFAGAPLVVPADRRVREAGGSDAGSLAISGRLQLRDLAGVLQVAAQRMPVLQAADRWVRADGGANIVFDQKRVQVNGAFAASAGFIDFSRPNLPTLSGDVQVVRNVEAPRAAREAPIGFAFDLGIDLGPAFYLRGLGLDTRIDGAVRLRSDGRAVRATGSVEARGGVYQGFGQRLSIERGRVNFQGPLENPGLDVLALRKGLPVEVGVAITRTAQNPLIRLYSGETMNDLQILSWLVLGRPPEESGADNTALATAAAGLLTGTSEGIPKQLARRLGIDEFGLRTGELAGGPSLLPRTAVAGNIRGERQTASAEILTVGKRLSDNITVSYEQALAGGQSVVQVIYRLSRRVWVVGRAGTDNALDLVYTIVFD